MEILFPVVFSSISASSFAVLSYRVEDSKRNFISMHDPSVLLYLFLNSVFFFLFLLKMEEADNPASMNHFILLCATNCPWELDSAFLRRFQKRIYIPLPDK